MDFFFKPSDPNGTTKNQPLNLLIDTRMIVLCTDSRDGIPSRRLWHLLSPERQRISVYSLIDLVFLCAFRLLVNE